MHTDWVSNEMEMHFSISIPKAIITIDFILPFLNYYIHITHLSYFLPASFFDGGLCKKIPALVKLLKVS